MTTKKKKNKRKKETCRIVAEQTHEGLQIAHLYHGNHKRTKEEIKRLNTELDWQNRYFGEKQFGNVYFSVNIQNWLKKPLNILKLQRDFLFSND